MSLDDQSLARARALLRGKNTIHFLTGIAIPETSRRLTMEEVNISVTMITIIGSAMTILLGLIAFFLARLIKQFDELQASFKDLIATVSRIDKDLSGDVGVLKTRLAEYDPIWDRLRQVETDLVAVKVGGCEQLKRCQQ